MSVNTSIPVTVYDLDLGGISSTITAAAIKANNPDRKVMCYVNVGALETDGSRADQSNFLASDQGSRYPGWPDEVFLDIRSSNVRNLMQARFQAMKAKGCDGIDPDNMALDYQGKSGFTPGLTEQDQVDYIKWFTTTIHALGMGVGSKNGGEIIRKHPELISLFDWVVIESCVRFDECGLYDPFVQAGKPVFSIDYTNAGSTGGCTPFTGTIENACATLNSHNFEALIKTCDLDGSGVQCRDFQRSAKSQVSITSVGTATKATQAASAPTQKSTTTTSGITERINFSLFSFFLLIAM
ncbi:hypothetical protein HDU79_000308 [Rhizoclosmatium sp. JEL0117]|nr:hypothetical protein HDU79_000308 [Rhizoclosmatium sp. JEL0117]